jgi:hypothetical protein
MFCPRSLQNHGRRIKKSNLLPVKPHRHLALDLIALVVIACSSLNAADETFRIKPISEEQAAQYKLDAAFFKKGTLVQNILIATSTNVSDFTHLEAAYQWESITMAMPPSVSGG